MFWIEIWVLIVLVLSLGLVCLFEFINGFHDTANAVAPVIYTKSLKPKHAILLSWILNFLGVLLWGIAVAMWIIHLLPLDVIAEQPTVFSLCLIASLLLSAIIWNAWTWYFWIPASSSHSLVGSILWVSIAMMFLPLEWWKTVTPNWHKAIEVFESLLISPIIWFTLAVFLMFLSYKLINSKKFFKSPKKWEEIKKPKTWLRAVLIWTSAWVSFAHWSNDWQKWVWIAMLIVISLIPSTFAINPEIKEEYLKKDINYIETTLREVEKDNKSEEVTKAISGIDSLKVVMASENQMKKREYLLQTQKSLKNITSEEFILINKANAWASNELQSEQFKTSVANLSKSIDYAPTWIILMISISLWLGTMIWRKRIVVTIWEKIGDTKMNYAQATNSALITAWTITVASHLWLPVSTTHIMSSSVAWTMIWWKWGWVQTETIKHILMAWVLTLPVTIFIAFTLFFVLFKIFVH